MFSRVFLGFVFLFSTLVPLQIVWADSTVEYEQYLLQLMNDSRREFGLPPYILSDEWSEVARDHSQDLADDTGGNIDNPSADKISHDSTDGRTTLDRIQETDFPWKSFGENVGWGGGTGSLQDIYDLIKKTHDVMMAEPPDEINHRSSILSENFDTAGIGVVVLEDEDEDATEVYFTADLIESIESTPDTIVIEEEEVEEELAPIALDIPDSEVIGEKRYVDTDALERLFVNRINELRDWRGLSPLSWDKRLHRSANDWTKEMIEEGFVAHDRENGESAHEWVEAYDLPFQDDYQDNYFTENIFFGVFTCLEECDFSPEREIERRFAEFLAEEPENGPHFRSMVHTDFTHVGVSVELKDNTSFYGTIHYARLEPETRIFPDIDADHPGRTAIEYLYGNNIVSGYSDGYFRPGKSVSRVEILKFLFNALNIEIDNTASVSFPDIPEDSWYYPYVATAVKQEIVKGYADGLYRPNQTVSRVEALKMILNAAKLLLPSVEGQIFTDVEVADWYAPYVKYAIYNELLDHPGKRFYVGNGMSREDVAQMLYRMIK